MEATLEDLGHPGAHLAELCSWRSHSKGPKPPWGAPGSIVKLKKPLQSHTWLHCKVTSKQPSSRCSVTTHLFWLLKSPFYWSKYFCLIFAEQCSLGNDTVDFYWIKTHHLSYPLINLWEMWSYVIKCKPGNARNYSYGMDSFIFEHFNSYSYYYCYEYEWSLEYIVSIYPPQ